jgi:hypothetical protein
MSNKDKAKEIFQLECHFEKEAERSQKQADELQHAQGSEAAAGEAWYQKDATDYKNVAQHLRNARVALGF